MKKTAPQKLGRKASLKVFHLKRHKNLAVLSQPITLSHKMPIIFHNFCVNINKKEVNF